MLIPMSTFYLSWYVATTKALCIIDYIINQLRMRQTSTIHALSMVLIHGTYILLYKHCLSTHMMVQCDIWFTIFKGLLIPYLLLNTLY